MAGAIPIISLIISIGSVVYSMTLNTDVGGEDTGTLVNKAGTRATRDVVYGECLTGATRVYSNVKDNNSSIRLDVFSCGVGVTSIKQLYIDGVEVLQDSSPKRETTSITSLKYTGSNLINGFEKQCTVQLRTGIPDGGALHNGLPIGTPMDLAIQNSDGEWTNRMRGDYTAAVAVTSKRIVDDEAIKIMSESFKVNMLVEGEPVFDPRRGSDPSVKQYRHSSGTNPECGRNPSLCLLDYITNEYYGLKIPFDKVDVNSFIDSANWCDSKNFKVDGQLNQGESFANNIEALAKSAGLVCVIVNGKIYALYEDIELPVHHFDAKQISEGGLDNILNKSFTVRNSSSGEYVNVMETDYKNSELNDETDTHVIPENIYPESQSPDYPSQVQRDGYLNQGSLALPMVRMSGANVNDENSQVRYLANVELNKQRFQKEVEFDIDLTEDYVRVFDVIEVSNSEWGWDKKLFRIKNITSRFTDDEYNTARVIANEYNDSIYSATQSGTRPSEPIKDRVQPTAPVNLVFNQYNTGNNSGATLIWDRTYFETNSGFIVEYKKSSSNSWISLGKVATNKYEFPLLPYDLYDFRVATYSNLLGSSDFTELLNQEVSSFGVLPPVTGSIASLHGANFDFSWDNMLEEDVSLPANPDPRAPKDPKVKDYFSRYEIDIYNNGSYKKTYRSVDSRFTYSFEENKSNGLSRTVRADIKIVATDGSKSQLGSGSTIEAINPQHPVLSGFSTDNNQFSSVSLRWDTSTEGDYQSTTIRRKKGANGSYEYINVVGSFYMDLLPDEDPAGSVYYYNVSARDVFDATNLNWSNEISVTKQSIDSLRPEFNNELDKIRDPDYASNKDGELVISTTNPNKDKVAGFGLYAPEGTGNTKAIFAADEFVISAGGYTEWDATKTYNVGDKVTVTIAPDVQQLYECIEPSTGDFPPDSEIQWSLRLGNTYQGAFYFDSITDQLILRSAVIKELDAGAITTGTLDADRIAGNSIEGGKIRSDTTIIAGDISNFDPSIIGTNGETAADIQGEYLLTVGETYVDTNADGSPTNGGYARGDIFVAFHPANPPGDLELIQGEEIYGSIMEFATITGDIGTRLMVRETGTHIMFTSYEGKYFPEALTIVIGNKRYLFQSNKNYEPWPGVYNIFTCEDLIFTNNEAGKAFRVIIHDSDITLLDTFINNTVPVAGMNGDDTDPDYKNYAFWSGSETPEGALFNVTSGGTLNALSANIQGHIQAESGYFNGSLSAADFRGANIYGTNIEGATIKGGTIIGSTIYAAQQEILADPYGTGVVTYYESYPEIPVSVQKNIDIAYSFTSSKSVYTIRNLSLKSAADRKGEPDQIRSKYITIPESTFTLSQSVKHENQIISGNPAIDIIPPDIMLQFFNSNNELVEQITGLNIPFTDFYAQNNKWQYSIFSVRGVSFQLAVKYYYRVVDLSGNDGSPNNRHYFYMDLTFKNLSSSFGSTSSTANNGYFKIGYKSVIAKTNSFEYNTNGPVNIRTYLDNPED